jgi:TRAP-type C4-dicarboxylate transport system substrate-binding protein
MKRYLVLIMALVVIGALLIPACSSAATTTTTPPTSPTATATTAQTSTTAPATSTTPVQARKIKFGYTMPKGASIGAGFEWFATEFTKRTNGRYVVETYPSNTLVPSAGALDAVTSGAAEMMGTSTGTFPKNFPLSLVVSIPTLGFPGGVTSSYVEGSDAIWELINGVPEVQNEYQNYKLLWTYMLDPYNLVSKKAEIHAPSDFKGLKIGGSGAKMEMVAAAGGAKVQMIPPDSQQNLDKGVVDAAFLTMAQVVDYKLYEICNYFYLQDFGGGNYVILMNKDFWNSMSAADQKTLTDIWREANVVSGNNSLASVQEGIKDAQDAGRKVVTPTAAESAAWQTAADAAVTSWKNDAKALGVSDDILNKVLAAWKTARDKHIANVK